FSSRRRHTRSDRDWSSDVCSSDVARKNRVLRALTPDAQPFNVDLGGGYLTGMVRVRPKADDPLAFDPDALTQAYFSYAEQMRPRSEELRVGKEGGAGWGRCHGEER